MRMPDEPASNPCSCSSNQLQHPNTNTRLHYFQRGSRFCRHRNGSMRPKVILILIVALGVLAAIVSIFRPPAHNQNLAQQQPGGEVTSRSTDTPPRIVVQDQTTVPPFAPHA